MIAWDKDYKIGVPAIDSEHLILFSLLNQLEFNSDVVEDEGYLSDVLGALLTYVRVHFAHEEQLMSSLGYQKLFEHQRAHSRFTEHIMEMQSDYSQRTDSVSAARDLKKFILDWLLMHILNVDAEFAEWESSLKV